MVKLLVISVAFSVVINALLALDWFIQITSEPPRDYECTGIEGEE